MVAHDRVRHSGSGTSRAAPAGPERVTSAPCRISSHIGQGDTLSQVIEQADPDATHAIGGRTRAPRRGRAAIAIALVVVGVGGYVLGRSQRQSNPTPAIAIRGGYQNGLDPAAEAAGALVFGEVRYPERQLFGDWVRQRLGRLCPGAGPESFMFRADLAGPYTDGVRARWIVHSAPVGVPKSAFDAPTCPHFQDLAAVRSDNGQLEPLRALAPQEAQATGGGYGLGKERPPAPNPPGAWLTEFRSGQSP